MSDDKDAKDRLHQFGLGPEDEAHNDAGAPRKGEAAAGAGDSGVNTVGLGSGDQQPDRS